MTLETQSILRQYQLRSHVVFVGGVFDLFHVGHVNLLRRASAMGSHLVVGVLTDEAAEAYKPRPVIPFEERIEVVRACRYVNAAVPLEASDATPVLQILRPQVLIHGSDHTPEWEIGQTWMLENGREFVLVPYTAGVSSSAIKRRVLFREAQVVAK